MKFKWFSSKNKNVEKKALAQKNKEFWLNELQCLFTADGTEVVCVRGRDIECLWTEGNGQPYWNTREDGSIEYNPNYKTFYMMSTKNGKQFMLTRKSWLKCRFENPEYNEKIEA